MVPDQGREMAKIYVIHENSAWVDPLRLAFENLNQPFEEWFLDEGTIPLHDTPPEGIFYNRMSASSHTRGHRFGPELTHATLNWLEAAGRYVVNGTRALYLEVSKVAQYSALTAAGIEFPRTVAVVGRGKVVEAARNFGHGPWILKPNRGGKGLAVQLFHDLESIEAYLDGPGSKEEAPIDGIWLVQDYIRAPEPFITRCEFVGGRFLYAVKVDTSAGFELCPADACNIENTFCPADSPKVDKFEILQDFGEKTQEKHYISRLEQFLKANQIGIAGIEFIRDDKNRLFTYDINTNTNYNAEAEKAARIERTGMSAVATLLKDELTLRYPISRGIAAAE